MVKVIYWKSIILNLSKRSHQKSFQFNDFHFINQYLLQIHSKASITLNKFRFRLIYIKYLSTKSMKLVLLSLVLLLAFACSNKLLNLKYKDFLHGKQPYDLQTVAKIYSEFRGSFSKSSFRFQIFNEKLLKIIAHNSAQLQWTKGINAFSDMTREEFKQSKLMAPQECSATNRYRVAQSLQNAIPENYDWLNSGIMTPVKDQGDCGSCWTFSTVGTMQAYWNLLKKGRDLLFSQQQLVDCASNFNNFGCDGGLPSQAFEYITWAKGLETAATYPYTGLDGQCTYRPDHAVAYVKYGSFNITRGDEEQLAQRLYNAGPIAVSFQVLDDFEDYEDGIYSSPECGTTTMDVNHAVVLTGYGVKNGVKFWNIKNSWSTEWGHEGYFKIQRGVNMCAISQCNSYPLIDRDSLNNLEEIKQE